MDTTDELPRAPSAELVLGRYRLGERLGAGGFGTVYAAVDERLQRPVAVKVIPTPVRSSTATRGRREALAAGRLDHPAIVAVFDAGEDGRARYLISELVYGRTVDALSAEGVLSDRDVLRIGLALCDALEHAHARGVVHRDVKPQNVLVPDAPRSAAGVAKLADFGVAHLVDDEPLTRTGDVVGTLAYMAPEQAAGQRVDERADLYSLALVLYEALAGVEPGARRLARRDRAPRRHRAARAAARAARTCRRSCAPRSTAALRPKPDERGTLDELARRRWPARSPRSSDEGGTVAPHPLERTEPLPLPAGARAGAAALAGGLAAAGWSAPAPSRPRAGLAATVLALGPRLGALIAAALVAVLPRVGWLVAAVAVIAVLAAQRPGAAVLVAAAARPRPAAAAPPRHRVVGPRRSPRCSGSPARRRVPGARRPARAAR